MSSKQRKKIRQEENKAARERAEVTNPPGSPPIIDDRPPPPPPPPPPLLSTAVNQQPERHSSLTIHIYHDSNAKFITPDSIQNTIDQINKQQNKPATNYNIQMHATYELQQTYNHIKRTIYKPDDIILLNILMTLARPSDDPQNLYLRLSSC